MGSLEQQGNDPRDELLPHLREHFGSDCEIESIAKANAGARKQIYFVKLTRPKTRFVLYIWRNEGGFFAERVAAGFEETQTDANAPDLFLTDRRFLAESGIKVPEVLHAGTLESGHRFCFVEEIVGRHLQTFAAEAPRPVVEAALKEVNAMLTRLHSLERGHPGTLEQAPDEATEQPVDETFRRATLEVEVASSFHPEVNDRRKRIEQMLSDLRAPLAPRTSFRLTHGELNHLFVRDEDHAVYLLDVEGIRFFDLEAEHVFLQWIYRPRDYKFLKRDDLERDRMEFYKLAMHISLVYAGSSLLRGGAHDQTLANRIYTRNLEQVPQLLEGA